MDSYNENLHSAVVNTLESLNLAKQNLKSAVNASMFKLYHAEGATLTAKAKFDISWNTLMAKGAVKEQVLKNSNISNNLLNSANQANQYLKQSATNTSVCASNVQIAASSVVRLASDIGSIFSIVNANDYESDVYNQAKKVHQLINETAYDAELASQLAMKAATLTAEVSSSTVLDQSKVSNTGINDLLKFTSADFDTTSQLVLADNVSLSAVMASEKLLEGALENLAVDFLATREAVILTNKKLNLNLNVPYDLQTSTGFTVEFDLIKSPFDDGERHDHASYPVKDYYLIVVKESKKQTFSISNAENMLLDGSNGIIKVNLAEQRKVSQAIDIYNVSAPVKDSDEDEILLGANYVVFVLAIYMDEYKRKISTFDDYLSAPSRRFRLTNKLAAVAASTIKIAAYDPDKKLEGQEEAEKSFKNDQQNQSLSYPDQSTGEVEYTHILTFTAEEQDDVEYRCMFLPYDMNSTDDFLTRDSLKFLLHKEIANLEKIADEFDPDISDAEAAITEINTKLSEVLTDKNDIDGQVALFKQNHPDPSADDTKELNRLKGLQSATAREWTGLNDDFKKEDKKLNTLLAKKKASTVILTQTAAAKPGFLFNLILAQQVSADNYKRPGKLSGESGQWIVLIGPDTTDNFGSVVDFGKKQYIPVVLAISESTEDNQSAYTNAISDVTRTNYFPLQFTPAN